MFKCKRIITDNSFSYPDVELYMPGELDQLISKYITSPNLQQVVLKTNDGKFRVLTDWMIGVIEYCKRKPSKFSKRIERIVINGEISYGPCYLVLIEDYKIAHIPRIFKHQLSFFAEGNLYICHQDALIEVCL